MKVFVSGRVHMQWVSRFLDIAELVDVNDPGGAEFGECECVSVGSYPRGAWRRISMEIEQVKRLDPLLLSASCGVMVAPQAGVYVDSR
ncbi:Uncharacterised protein [Mycobacteroides abscessus subsp. bolletii]|nr:Uncharacterised protein [Mycobacteroides abscessus subsp. bolletii]